MPKAIESKDVTAISVPECLENLTPKQKKFAELYAVNGNAAKSALLAGYKTTGDGGDIGYALSHNPNVIPAVEYYRAIFADQSTYTPEKVIKEWCEMASVDVSAFVDDDWDMVSKSQLTPAQRHALVGLETSDTKFGRKVKPKFAKVEALKELGKLLGMYASEEGKSQGLDIQINLGTQVNVSVSEHSTETDTEIGHLTIKRAQRGES
jgi:hypothetical protein